MTVRSALIMMLSLVFGGSAAVGVNRFVKSRPGPVVGPDTVPVVVTAVDIPRGASISAGMIKVCDYPRAMAGPGAMGRVEDVLDRAASIPLVKDEPVLESKLAPKGAGRGMAALVPDAMRAFTIHTPSVASGVGGFILPGNKVDVLLTMEGTRGSVTITLLQNLEILAVDQRIDAPADNRVDPNHLRSVTLLVTPDQAARLGQAQNKGALHLSLRNLTDDRIAETTPARQSDLYGEWEESQVKVVEAPRPPIPQKKGIPLYRGNQLIWCPIDGSHALAFESESTPGGPEVLENR